MRVTKAPYGMPVECWSVIGPHSPTISGFPTAEAARAWATEWGCCPNSIVAPVCKVAHATAALVRAEIEYDRRDAEEDGPDDDYADEDDLHQSP